MIADSVNIELFRKCATIYEIMIMWSNVSIGHQTALMET